MKTTTNPALSDKHLKMPNWTYARTMMNTLYKEYTKFQTNWKKSGEHGQAIDVLEGMKKDILDSPIDEEDKITFTINMLDFPQDRSADTHDCGTRLGDVAKPADVSVPFGHSDGRQTVRAANAEFHGSTFLTGSAGESKILKILCDGKVSKDTQWKDIEED